MAKIGFFIGDLSFGVNKYIVEEIDCLNSLGIQPFIFSDKKFSLKKYFHTELESSLSVWQSLKSLNGIVEESDFLKALKRSAHIFEDETIFATATKASMVIKNKKLEIINAYSPQTYYVAMVCFWITRVPFGISILTPEILRNVQGIETLLKEASFIVVYSDAILKDLKSLGYFDTDKVLRVFPGLNPSFLPLKEKRKICIVGEENRVIQRVSSILQGRERVLAKENHFYDMQGKTIKNFDKEDGDSGIENFEIIVYSSFPSLENMFSLENRLLRKALYYGIPVLILGNFKGGENNVGKLLRNFVKSEEQFEEFLLKLINEEKLREKFIAEGKEIASALFDLQRNSTLLKGLFEKVLLEKIETHSMDKWLKRSRKLPRKK